MKINLRVNDTSLDIDVAPGDNLLKVLRSQGYFSVKHGCETGDCGACTILLDGKPVNSCVMLAAQAEGHHIQTLEAVGQHPEQGWKTTGGLHPLQQAFVETGAIQCGYCTPGMVLSATALIEKNASPSDDEIKEALAGNICRCTGYH
ncbi:MAG: (2Fe-2S)-binding protein, partial [Anaerolineales bacterium]|nr:(2Fe-2S)-binding protein [Anaerolineales bacterium]